VVKLDDPVLAESKPVDTRENGMCFLYCCHILRTVSRSLFERLISKEMLRDNHGVTTWSNTKLSTQLRKVFFVREENLEIQTEEVPPDFRLWTDRVGIIRGLLARRRI